MTKNRVDLAVIGGGPGGYVAAIRGAKNGLKTILIEKDKIGGTCLNHGCIPSKALIHAAEIYHTILNSRKIGITAKGASLDFDKVMAWKGRIVKKLTMGIDRLLAGNQIKIISGTAHLANSNTIKVATKDGAVFINAKKIIIATGSKSVELPFMPFDGDKILSSKELFSIGRLPDKMIVVGGGVIGVELGQAFGKLGTKVTIIEALDSLLPQIPSDLKEEMIKSFRRQKISFHTRAKVTGAKTTKTGVKTEVLLSDGSEKEIEGEIALVTIGLRPNSYSIGLENTGARVDGRGFIVVDDSCKTADPNIFAIGDVAGEPLLAHKASAQGIVAADMVAGKEASIDLDIVPLVVYCDPEIASVGLTEEDCLEMNKEVLVGKYPFAGHGRAAAMDELGGFVKTIADAKTHSLLGIQIVGAGAGELIGEGVLALQNSLKVENLGTVIHPHPTMSEGITESAEAAINQAIHLLVK